MVNTVNMGKKARGKGKGPGMGTGKGEITRIEAFKIHIMLPYQS